MKRRIARREFLLNSTLGTVGAGAVVGSLTGTGSEVKAAPSDQVVVGIIGPGRHGIGLLRHFRNQADVQVAAVCDVYRPHLRRAIEESGAEGYEDFRRVLERRDIDAVVIATPDHWHPLQTVLACQSGKDVYVEKPVSVVVAEGRRMIEAARKYDRIVQVGTQQRSGNHFRRAVELIRSGDLGKITAVRTWNYGNSHPEGIGAPPDGAPPEDLDWNLWLGPAADRPFNANRFGVAPDRWSTFRYFWDYAGGMLTDWGAHHLDVVQWAMDVKGPEEVAAVGGKFVLEDNRDSPDTLTVTYRYPGFLCTYENRDANGRRLHDKGGAVEFHGTEGTLLIDRSGFEIFPETRPEGDRRVARMYWMKEENSNNHSVDHVRDFLDCVKSRRRPRSDIEEGHFSAAACHLGNVAYRTGRSIRWDAEREVILDDTEASRLLSRQYRSPWKLEV